MSNIQKVVRIAPSPTGNLHIATMRVGLINYYFAKKHNGKCILRIDDTDQKRSEKKYEEEIIQMFKEYDVEWSELIRQSERNRIYKEFFDILIKKGKIFPCYETEEELLNLKTLNEKLGKPMRVKCREYNTEEIEIFKKENRQPYWRINLDEYDITINDNIFGKITRAKNQYSDPVICTSNGQYTYLFTSVIDDLVLNVTDIIRGSDHIENTFIQLKIAKLLVENTSILKEDDNRKKNEHIFEFYHLPILCNENGQKLSKRDKENNMIVKDILSYGLTKETIKFFCLFMGTKTTIKDLREITDENLLRFFDIKYKSTKIATSIDKLKYLNSKVLRIMNHKQIKSYLPKEYGEMIDKHWNLIKENVKSLNDIQEFLNCLSNINVHSNYREFVSKEEMKNIIEEFIKNHSDIENILLKLNIEKKKIYFAIYSLFFGKTYGPPMADLLQLITEEQWNHLLESL